MHNHVSGLAEHRAGFGGDQYAPGRIRRADHFAEVAPGLGGIGVNRADHFNGLLFAQQAHDGRSDRANSVLNRAYFLFAQDLFTRLQPIILEPLT